MDAISFCYWLQGFLELGGQATLTEQQAQIVKDHLKLVFEKKTPDYTLKYPPGVRGGLRRLPTEVLLAEYDAPVCSLVHLSC